MTKLDLQGRSRFFFGLFLLLFLAAACNFGPPQKSVSGTIRLALTLPASARRARSLFIILEAEGGGPPLAIQHLIEPKLPYRYVVTADDVMIKGRPFTGRVRVRVRLDANGLPGPLVRGDFEGRTSGAVTIGATGVDVTIDRAGTAEPPKVVKRSRPKRKALAPPRTRPQPIPAGGATITGQVTLTPALAAKAAGKPILYLIARTGGPGPPLAVVKIPNPRFPQSFTLSRQNVMMPNVPFAGSVRISARLDSDGNAGPAQPGDLVGKSEGLIPVGAKGVTIVLRREVGASAPAPPPAVAAAAGGVISGTVTVSAALAARAKGKPVLYLIVRGAQPGPPLAVVRIANPRFPLPFRITKENVMMPGVPFAGKVRITARIDSDGNAGRPQPGDMENSAPAEVVVGDRNVKIIVDKAY